MRPSYRRLQRCGAIDAAAALPPLAPGGYLSAGWTRRAARIRIANATPRSAVDPGPERRPASNAKRPHRVPHRRRSGPKRRPSAARVKRPMPAWELRRFRRPRPSNRLRARPAAPGLCRTAATLSREPGVLRALPGGSRPAPSAEGFRLCGPGRAGPWGNASWSTPTEAEPAGRRDILIRSGPATLSAAAAAMSCLAALTALAALAATGAQAIAARARPVRRARARRLGLPRGRERIAPAPLVHRLTRGCIDWRGGCIDWRRGCIDLGRRRRHALLHRGQPIDDLLRFAAQLNHGHGIVAAPVVARDGIEIFSAGHIAGGRIAILQLHQRQLPRMLQCGAFKHGAVGHKAFDAEGGQDVGCQQRRQAQSWRCQNAQRNGSAGRLAS